MIGQENVTDGITSLEHAVEFLSEHMNDNVEIVQRRIDGVVSYRAVVFDEFGEMADAVSSSFGDALVKLAEHLDDYLGKQLDWSDTYDTH